MNDLFAPDPLQTVFDRLVDEWKAVLGSQCQIGLDQHVNHLEALTYKQAVTSGCEYLCGPSFPLDKFLKEFTTEIDEVWLTQACQFVRLYPENRLTVFDRARRKYWVIHSRFDHVCIRLPHQDLGGERAWVTIDCKHKILVDQD